MPFSTTYVTEISSAGSATGDSAVTPADAWAGGADTWAGSVGIAVGAVVSPGIDTDGFRESLNIADTTISSALSSARGLS